MRGFCSLFKRAYQEKAHSLAEVRKQLMDTGSGRLTRVMPVSQELIVGYYIKDSLNIP